MRSNELYALSLLVSKITGRIIRFDKFATRRYKNNKVIMTIIIKSNTFFLDIERKGTIIAQIFINLPFRAQIKKILQENWRIRRLSIKVGFYSIVFFFFLMHRRNISLYVRRYAAFHRTRRFDIYLYVILRGKKKKESINGISKYTLLWYNENWSFFSRSIASRSHGRCSDFIFK